MIGVNHVLELLTILGSIVNKLSANKRGHITRENLQHCLWYVLRTGSMH